LQHQGGGLRVKFADVGAEQFRDNVLPLAVETVEHATI